MPADINTRDDFKIVTTAAPVPRSLGSKIIRSVIFGGFRQVLVAPIPFIMTPLILHRIGVLGYGTWAVFVAVNGLTSLADLGLVGTLSKFVAEYHAREDFAALSRLLSSGLALFLLLDLLISGGLWAATPLLAGKFFHGSIVPRNELIGLLRLFLIVLAGNILTQLFASVTTGLQRLDLTHVMSAASTIMSAAFSGALLLRGDGLRGLVLGYIASAVLTVTIYLILVRKLLPEAAINPFRFDPHEARKMFGYSLRLYITQAAVMVQNQTEKVLLAFFVGVAPAGWYDIAGDVALKIRGTIGLVLSPVLPAASELDALGDHRRTEELYYRSHKYLALVGVPVVCFVIAIANHFVDLWLGPSLKLVAVPLSVLLALNFINLATGPGFLIFAGAGNLKPGMRSAVLSICVNLVLSLGLIYMWGFAGAVIGTAMAMLVGSLYFMVLFHLQTGYSVRRVLRSYLKPGLCSVLILASILLVHPVGKGSWFGLAETGAIFCVLYLAAILQLGFFDEYDWNKVERFIPSARCARRIVRIA